MEQPGHQSNSGPIGQYSASGTQPNGAVTMTMDGANLLDPGTRERRWPISIKDQTAEVTLPSTSAFGAEYANGPVTLQAIGKSGSAQFPRRDLFYAHAWALDSLDSISKGLGGARPSYSSYYPGGAIGGPVLIPGSNSTGTATSSSSMWGPKACIRRRRRVTTRTSSDPQMLAGNFFTDVLNSLGAGFAATKGGDSVAAHPHHGAAAAYPGGVIPANLLNPDSLAYAKTFPQPTWSQPDATGKQPNLYFGFDVNRSSSGRLGL